MDLLGFQHGPEHTKPTVLTDIVHFQEHKSALMLKVRPAGAGKCVLECAFYSGPSISDSSVIICDVKKQITNCISTLESTYANIRLIDSM